MNRGGGPSVSVYLTEIAGCIYLRLASVIERRNTTLPPCNKIFSLREFPSHTPLTMDPLSIVVASESLVGICGKLSGYITWLNKTQVNTTIGILRVEIDSLSHVFASISTNFGKRSLASLAPHTKLEERHWKNVRQSMNDCKETLEKLHELLQPVVKEKRGGLFKKSVKVIELDVNPNDIALFQQEVMAYRKTMEISLQVMTLYAPFLVSLINGL
jgi:hypothetical protein